MFFTIFFYKYRDSGDPICICYLVFTETTHKWDVWGAWQPCSVTCGGRSGVMTRRRLCVIGPCEGPAQQVMQCHAYNRCQEKDTSDKGGLIDIHGNTYNTPNMNSIIMSLNCFVAGCFTNDLFTF